MIEFDFRGRTAIVTGGARGIGRAIADRLAASGAKVAIWDLLAPVPASDLYTQPAETYASHRLDCTDGAQVQAAFDRSLAQLGKVDILVNAAGVTGPTKPIEDYSLDEWQRVVRINLDSVFLASKAVIPQMRSNGYGRIVSIASVAGKQGNPFMVGYSAAKGGVISLTKALALELADTGILVNCITPALIGTELLKDERRGDRDLASQDSAWALWHPAGGSGHGRLDRLGRMRFHHRIGFRSFGRARELLRLRRSALDIA